ncbi:MAG: DUF6036 family nucleotidyltransferase [Actinomycetota bacterium]
MTREELQHLIRAAGDIADDDIIVIGSQAILAVHPHAPARLLVSMEADVSPRRDPGSALAIDAAIGDVSHFHESFGYYAHGVGPETAIAPAGWQDRLVPIDAPSVARGQRPRRGWCLEPHDLMLAKLAANRERDWEFVEVALRCGLVDPEVLTARADTMPHTHREHVRRRLAGVIVRAGNSP